MLNEYGNFTAGIGMSFSLGSCTLLSPSGSGVGPAALVMGKFSSVQFGAYIAWTLNWTNGSVWPNCLNHELNHGSGSNQIEPKPVCLIT